MVILPASNYIKMILIMIGSSQDLDRRRMEEKITI
jgi:hypothetical protein